MKICILSIVNIKHMSLISMYTSFFDKNGIDYDIVYIDKYGEDECITAKRVYKYSVFVNRKWNKLKKILVYWGFRKFALNIIDKNKYDFIIVWKTETAIMFSNYLSKKMKKMYCLNIRDYCMEKNPIIYNIVKKVIHNALFTTISSDGYKKFLPKSKYITVHSYNKSLLKKNTENKLLKQKDKPINICFIGYVRFFEVDKKLIDAFRNDKRFVIQFFGEGSEQLREYSKLKGIFNVEFVGNFPIEDTPKLLKNADVINNLYGHNTIALDSAVSIKYYYALHLNIPILVFKSTYMDEISKRAGIGYSVGKDFTELPDKFYNWYHSIDYSEFKKNCVAEIVKTEKDLKEFNLILTKLFKNY